MRVRRQGGALPGLEIHHVVPDRAAPERAGGVQRLVEDRQIDAEGAVHRFRAADRLEDEVDRRSATDRFDRGGDVGEDAALRRDLEAADHLVQHPQEVREVADVVGGRVDPDHGVAAPVEQAVEDGGQDDLAVVRRVVRLEADGQRAGEADRVAETGHDPDLARRQDQVLVAHDLGDGGGHLRSEPGGEPRQRRGGRRLRQQPVSKVTDGQMGDRGEGRFVVAVDDQARHRVGLVGDHRLVEEPAQRKVGERHSGGDGLGGARRRDAGERVAGAGRGGLREEVLQIGEDVARAAAGAAIHGCPVPHFAHHRAMRRISARDGGL